MGKCEKQYEDETMELSEALDDRVSMICASFHFMTKQERVRAQRLLIELTWKLDELIATTDDRRERQ